MYKTRSIPAVAACALLAAGCTTMTYDDLPGPTSSTSRTVAAAPAAVCDAVVATAADIKLTVDSRRERAGGCTLEVSRRPPNWLPGDDGERLLVQVDGDPAGARVTANARRVAPGQVWIDSVAGPLLDGAARRSVRGTP